MGEDREEREEKSGQSGLHSMVEIIAGVQIECHGF